MKRSAFVLSVMLLCGVAVSGFAEKLTTVGIIDIEKLYTSFDTGKLVKEFEAAKKSIQDELNGHILALNKLKDQKLQASNTGDASAALRLEQEINQKTVYIAEFRKVKQAQLDDMKKNIVNSDEVMRQLDAAIEFVAISEGFTIVLMSGTQSGVFWWSSEVDITNKVIERLKQVRW